MEKKLEYFRCQTCGNLLSRKAIAQGVCAGHRMVFATNVSIWEWIKAHTGLLK